LAGFHFKKVKFLGVFWVGFTILGGVFPIQMGFSFKSSKMFQREWNIMELRILTLQWCASTCNHVDQWTKPISIYGNVGKLTGYIWLYVDQPQKYEAWIIIPETGEDARASCLWHQIRKTDIFVLGFMFNKYFSRANIA
jgi:hypothetical protein